MFLKCIYNNRILYCIINNWIEFHNWKLVLLKDIPFFFSKDTHNIEFYKLHSFKYKMRWIVMKSLERISQLWPCWFQLKRKYKACENWQVTKFKRITLPTTLSLKGGKKKSWSTFHKPKKGLLKVLGVCWCIFWFFRV